MSHCWNHLLYHFQTFKDVNFSKKRLVCGKDNHDSGTKFTLNFELWTDQFANVSGKQAGSSMFQLVVPLPCPFRFFPSLSLFCACHLGAEYLLRGSRFLDNLKLFAQMNWDVNVYSTISRPRPNIEGLKSRSSFGSDVELRTRLNNQLN